MGRISSLTLPALLLLTGCVDYDIVERIRKDAFYQANMKMVDLLFVVDNSLSMVEEQGHLAENFEVLIDAFTAADVDWRLMVTTTEAADPWRGQLMGRTDEILVTRSDGLLLDRVAWEHTFTADVSLQLDPTAWNATDNDEAGAWCDSLVPTPGRVNLPCEGGSVDPVVPGTDQGPHAPREGEVIVTEIMALTSGLDSQCEWLELSNTSSDTLKLDGMVLSDEGRDRVTLPEGTLLLPLQSLVVGRDPDAEDLCGTSVDLAFPEGLSLADGTLWIDEHTPDPKERFGELVAVGQGSYGFEMGLEAARLATSEPWYTEDNGAFLRDEASLSILFVSDEDDLSPDPVATYVSAYMSLKGDKGFRVPGTVNLVAITGLEPPATPDGPSCTSENGNAEWGERYIKAVDLAGGVQRSICDDFTDVVSSLELTEVLLERDFALSERPDPETLQVELYASDAEDALVWPLTRDVDFRLVVEEPPGGREVVLLSFPETDVPPLGSVVVATYWILAEGEALDLGDTARRAPPLSPLWLTGCANPNACEDDLDCVLGSVCLEGLCTTEYCKTSTDCGMEEHCESRRCADGCEMDSDCPPGNVCFGAVCEPTACVSARTDCGWNQVCVDGTCVDAGDAYCASCDTDEECEQGICWEGMYCGVDCTVSDDCPSGFDCLPVSRPEGTRMQCLSACWLPR